MSLEPTILDWFSWASFYLLWYLGQLGPGLIDCAVKSTGPIGFVIARLAARWIDKHPDGGWGP